MMAEVQWWPRRWIQGRHDGAIIMMDWARFYDLKGADFLPTEYGGLELHIQTAPNIVTAMTSESRDND